MKKREGVLENCQIQLHHNPETAQDLFKHLQPQTIQLPPLENGEILIKVLYIALDPSLKPLLAGEKNSSDSPHSNDMVYDHPHSESTHLDEKGSKLDPPRIDITTNQSTENTHFANYFPPPFSKQQEWIESNHPSISINSSTDPRRILNYGVLKAYAVGEVIESKNHLFTKGRNVYGNLGVQQYLLSNGGKDLDDNIVRDITLDSPLSAFLTLSKAGLCAYFGVTELTNVSEGECVFVSGGTGCVGSFVPQVVRAYLSDKKIREGIKKEEHHDHNMSTHKNSPSSSNNNHTHNGEKTALCSSSHCLVPHRSCNKAKSPTLSWLFNSLIEEENEEEYDLSHSNNEDEEHFPKSSHEVISREDEPSEPTHFVQHDPIVTPHGQIYYSPEEMKHGHHHHLPHHHHPHFHNAERLNMMNSAVATHKNPPQIKIFGFCSSESRKTLMTNKLKYDNAINYSNYMLKKNTNSSESGGVDESSPLLNSPVCASCLTPAWSSVSPFTHVYGANTSTQSTSDNSNSICGVLRDQPADTCLLKTGQRYDYSNIDRDALSKAIGEMCPDGIDVVFDTVGGVLLDLCLEHLKMNARIVICGAITNNSSTTSLDNNNRETFKFEGPHNYVNLILKCARMEGFMVEKFQTKFKQASHTLVRWIQEKKIDSLEENVLECDLKDRSQVINAIEKLFSGEYYGKLIIRVKQNTTI